MDPQIAEYRRRKKEEAAAQRTGHSSGNNAAGGSDGDGTNNALGDTIANIVRTANTTFGVDFDGTQWGGLLFLLFFFVRNFSHLWPLLLLFIALLAGCWKCCEFSPETRAAREGAVAKAKVIAAGNEGGVHVWFWQPDSANARVSARVLIVGGLALSIAVGMDRIFFVVLLWVVLRWGHRNREGIQKMLDNPTERTTDNVKNLFFADR